MNLGKLIGKAVGEVIALPATIAAETVEATREAVAQTGKAIERAGEKIEGDGK